MLQRIAVCYIVLQRCNTRVLQRVLQRAAVCCIVLQHVTICCILLQRHTFARIQQAPVRSDPFQYLAHTHTNTHVHTHKVYSGRHYSYVDMCVYVCTLTNVARFTTALQRVVAVQCVAHYSYVYMHIDHTFAPICVYTHEYTHTAPICIYT